MKENYDDDDDISKEADKQPPTNLKDDLDLWETKLNECAEDTPQENVKNVLENVIQNVIQNVEYENLNPNDNRQNSEALKTYLKDKKIDIKDFLIALQNKDGDGPQVSLRKKLRLYMLLVSKNDRKFSDIFRLMDDWNYRFESDYFLDLKHTNLGNISEVRNFTHHDQYIEFFKGLPNGEKTLRNLFLIPNFIIFWNMDLDKNKTEDYDKIIDDLFENIGSAKSIFTNNKEKYKQTIKNMHLICVKSMNSSYGNDQGRCLATKLKDKDGNLIDVSQTFSDFADMLREEELIDENTRDRLKSGPNFLLLRLSVIWKYIKFFFRKNILCQENIYYGYDSEILIKKIDHFGNILAPGWFNCDMNLYNKWKKDSWIKDHVSNFVYTANQYFKKDNTFVLDQMLIQKGLTEAQNKESPNFKKKEVEVTEENNVEKKEPEKEEKETIIVNNINNKESKE